MACKCVNPDGTLSAFCMGQCVTTKVTEIELHTFNANFNSILHKIDGLIAYCKNKSSVEDDNAKYRIAFRQAFREGFQLGFDIAKDTYKDTYEDN